MTANIADQDAPLRNDIRMLGGLLGITLKQQEGEEIFKTVEEIRVLSKAIKKDAPGAEKKLLAKLRGLSLEQLVPVTKAFSQFLNFTTSIAEPLHRIRRTRLYKM